MNVDIKWLDGELRKVGFKLVVVNEDSTYVVHPVDYKNASIDFVQLDILETIFDEYFLKKYFMKITPMHNNDGELFCAVEVKVEK